MLRRYLKKYIHPILFLVTLITTTMAGAEWMGKSMWMESFTFSDFAVGFSFSFPFLLILSVHEFGHYFTAQYHKVKVTLPYYIPLWFFGLGPSIGTMGAFIKIQDPIYTRKHYFDIGIAGPLAGFVVAVIVLFIGFTNLPPKEYIYEIHPEYKEWGMDYPKYAYEDKEGLSLQLGPNLLFSFFEHYVADPTLLPHPNEVIHYPLLLAGYLALFFTALNLLPIGQLDGGHILYGFVGARWHRRIASILFIAFLTYAGVGVINPHKIDNYFGLYLAGYVFFLYYACTSLTRKKQDRLVIAVSIMAVQFFITYFFPMAEGYSGWLLFAFLIGRVLGVQHPPVPIDQPLSQGRKILGWIAFVVFILCFSPEPLILE